jgi:tetratricopeptide (TPR) repeat protein
MTDDELFALLNPLGDSTLNLQRLQKQIATPLGVIPFVGAGLSIPFGFKSWGAFLLDQARKAGIESTVQAILARGEYEQAGEAVLTARGHRAFLNAIDAEFGDAKLRGKQLAGAVKILPRLARGPVITTNFDHVLERAFETAGARFERVVWGSKATSTYAVLTQDRRFLLKLHGDVEEQDDRVLTHADYEKYYGSSSPLCQVLRDLFVARPMLFIGCSLVSDRWVQLLGEVAQANTAVEHFALVEYPATDGEYVHHQQFLSDHGITPVWFPHTRFDLIEAILESIAPSSAPPMPLVHRNRLLIGTNDTLLAHTAGFFGRTSEVAAVVQFLREVDAFGVAMMPPTPKILLVTGSPGIGKSEVCKEALHQFLNDQPSARIYYVELADVRDTTGMFARLADAFDIPEATPDSVYAAIAGRPCLLYLDNLEDMLRDPDAFRALAQLAAFPDVRVLASSREHLAQLGYQPISKLDPDAAAELFINEWNKSAPGRPLADSPELREFVGTDLDCHALSIVLVAAQAFQAASLDELITRWREEATRLAQLPHGHDRLTSLAVSLERSLTAVQNESTNAVMLWGLCALFPEGMSPAAFDAVTKTLADDRFQARGVLLQLNIIRFQQPNESGSEVAGSCTNRMTMLMLAPLRRFILERTREGAAGQSIDELLNPAFTYFSGLATAAQQTELGYDRTARGIALDGLLPELLNLREAVVLAAQRGTKWVETLGTLSRALSNSYQFRALVSIDVLHALLPLQQQAHRALDTAHTLRHLGDLETRLGKVDAARQHYTAAMEFYTQERDNHGLANVLTNLGRLEQHLGEIDSARQHYTAAMEFYTQERDNLGIASVLMNLGGLEDRLGEINPARQHYERAVELYTQEGANLGLANALKGLGDLKSHSGEIDLARKHFDRAIELYRQERDNLGLANTLRSLGDLETQLGEIDLARKHFGQATELFTQERNNLGLANTLRSLGDLESRLGEAYLASQHYNRAIELFTQERVNLGLADALRSLGDLETQLGGIDAARQHYAEAMKLFTQERNNLGLANTVRSLGDLEKQLGEIGPARQHFDRAIELYAQERNNLGLANTVRSLGDLELTLSQFHQAGTHYARARELYIGEREMMGLAYTCAKLARVAYALNQPTQVDQYLDEAMRAAQTSNVPAVAQYVAQVATEIRAGTAKQHDGELGS